MNREILYRDYPSQWFDNFMLRLESDSNIKWTDPSTNKDIVTNISTSLIQMLNENRLLFVRVGQVIFKQFLVLMSRAENFEALLLIYRNLNTSDLINKYKENAAMLELIAADVRTEREFWNWLATQVAMRIAFGALGSLL